MRADPCANRTLSGEGAEVFPASSKQLRGQPPALSAHWPSLCSRRSAHKLRLALERSPLKLLQDAGYVCSPLPAGAGLPTGSYPVRNLSLGRGGRSGVLGMAVNPYPPERLRRRCSNYRKRECRARPSSGSPCTWCRSNGASYPATFGIPGRLCLHACDRGSSRCLFRRLDSWV